MSDFEDQLEEFLKKNPWLRDSVDQLKKVGEQVKQHQQDLNFRVKWLETYSLSMFRVFDLVLTDEQKDRDEYLAVHRNLNRHIKRFNPEFYAETLTDYRAMSEQSILKLGVHPEEEIERMRKRFDLEDLPQIITFHFIKTHFGDEQLEIYKQILEREGNF